MPKKTSSARGLIARAYIAGTIVAAGLLGALLYRGHVTGTPVPPSPNLARFSVAMLAGPKQAAQSAPANTEAVAEAVAPAPKPVDAPVVAAKRETSLPQAVKAAQESAPVTEVPTAPVEVLPPTQVSMPGGHLAAEEAPIGDSVGDPFEIKPRQVYIRLLVNAKGQVVRFGVVRSGGDPMRDGLILKAMRSRTYATDKLIRVDGNEPLWQLDLVLDYGNNDFLP